MTTITTDVRAIPRIKHAEAIRIAAVENDRFAAALRDLRPGDWAKPTDCTRWDVRALTAHVVGSAAAQASPREFARQVRAGRPVVAEIGAQYWWDGMNEVHVRERADRSPAQLIAEWDDTGPRALRARRRLPRPVAWLPLLNLPAPVGRKPLSYLFDIGFTRDTWMHRIDLTEAVGTAFAADPDHDGRLVADLVAEWAGTHGEAFTLTLTGPAGGTYTSGHDGEQVELDAVTFCRTLAGRLPGEGILRHPLPL
ncbi:MAG TPA: maleylpyruvate isomerase family mycothiol-dependent enzyme [Jatrophihabitantaceae bacterium]|jgi:uncharacterized protein (TIGR03083 family)